LGWGGGKFKKLQVETFMPGQGMKQLYEGVVRVRDGVAPAGSKTEQTVAVVTKIMSDRKNLRYDSFQRKSPGARPERQTNIVCGTQPLEIDEALKFYSTLDYCGSEVKFKVEYVQHVEPANKDVGAYCQSPIDGPTSQPSFGLKQIDPTYDVYICSSENAGGEPIVLSYKTLRGVVTSGDYVKRFLNADEKSRLCGKSPSTNAKLPYNAPITGGAPAAQ
jgi:hypothetical protein